jgi:hypothetical protein
MITPTGAAARPTATRSEIAGPGAREGTAGALCAAAGAAGGPVGGLAAVILGLWYLATMGRGLAWFDAAELALVAHTGGVSHPPGQPLYTLVTQALTWGPWPPLLA